MGVNYEVSIWGNTNMDNNNMDGVLSQIGINGCRFDTRTTYRFHCLLFLLIEVGLYNTKPFIVGVSFILL